MKIVFTPIATLLCIGAALLARAQSQGIEQALFATAVEWGASGLASAVRFPDFRRTRAAARLG